MTDNFFGKFLGFLLLVLSLSGCAGTGQDLRQELRDENSGIREKMAQAEKSYESRKYIGLTSEDSSKWNPTDWSMWMDAHGGGR